jgi:exopolyphosphatase/guanosine-5'-triphosphate,3'-diphosphate pyrophosphatase
MGAVGDVLVAAGWAPGEITQDGLDWLLQRLIETQRADNLRLPGMREDRKPIIGGGLSVVRALFRLLRIDTLQLANGGLRHGLVCDLLGSHGAAGDLRVSSVERLAAKFSVDKIHGQRVGRVACDLYRQLVGAAGHSPQDDRDAALRTLHWAAELHEIGSRISHSDYHKHGAYILDNADAMGFALSDLHRLSLLVLGHRGKLRKLGAALDDAALVCQLICLRLAIILCHARRDPDLQGMALAALEPGQARIRLQCRAGWSASYPQSAHLLREEVLAWDKTPWRLLIAGL